MLFDLRGQNARLTDHAEHAVELPADEEDDEEVVGVPEPLKVGTAALLDGEPHHGAQSNPHDPSGSTWTGEEVGLKEQDDAVFGVGAGYDGQAGKVEHVRDGVDKAEEDDGPCRELVEFDVLVEGDEVVEGGATKDGDEVAADRKEDERDVDVQDQSGCAGEGWVKASGMGGSVKIATSQGSDGNSLNP